MRKVFLFCFVLPVLSPSFPPLFPSFPLFRLSQNGMGFFKRFCILQHWVVTSKTCCEGVLLISCVLQNCVTSQGIKKWQWQSSPEAYKMSIQKVIVQLFREGEQRLQQWVEEVPGLAFATVFLSGLERTGRQPPPLVALIPGECLIRTGKVGSRGGRRGGQARWKEHQASLDDFPQNPGSNTECSLSSLFYQY